MESRSERCLDAPPSQARTSVGPAASAIRVRANVRSPPIADLVISRTLSLADDLSGGLRLKATYFTLGAVTFASLLLAGVMFYSAYCHFAGHSIPWFVGPLGGVAALVLVLAGRIIRLPGSE